MMNIISLSVSLTWNDETGEPVSMPHSKDVLVWTEVKVVDRGPQFVDHVWRGQLLSTWVLVNLSVKKSFVISLI